MSKQTFDEATNDLIEKSEDNGFDAESDMITENWSSCASFESLMVFEHEIEPDSTNPWIASIEEWIDFTNAVCSHLLCILNMASKLTT